MNNVTNDKSPTNNLFRRYLLGESIKNIFIRLTVILSAIIIVWCGIMFALIIHMKCQRTKQTLKTSNTHHHLYDSNTSLNKKRSKHSKRNRRCNSPSPSLSSRRCYSLFRSLSQLKQHCVFWPSSSSTVNENLMNRSSLLIKQRETKTNNSYSTPNKVQVVLQSMTRRTLTSNHNKINLGKRLSLYHEADSSSGDELKNLYPIETNPKSIQTSSNIIQRVYFIFVEKKSH